MTAIHKTNYVYERRLKGRMVSMMMKKEINDANTQKGDYSRN